MFDVHLVLSHKLFLIFLALLVSSKPLSLIYINLIIIFLEIFLDFYKFYSKVFSSSFKLLAFLLKIFKKFTCSVLLLFQKKSASVYSLKDFIVYFSMYFFVLLRRTICIIQYLFLFVNTFSTIFLKYFCLILRQNKKLVMLLLFYSLSISFITNSYVYFLFFVCCKVLFYNNIFLS